VYGKEAQGSQQCAKAEEDKKINKKKIKKAHTQAH